MKLMIEVEKVNELLEDYNKHKFKDETFSKFIERTKDNGMPVADWFDCCGCVTPEDFETMFKTKFIQDHFHELGEIWFEMVIAQIDFGFVIQNVADAMGDREDYKPSEMFVDCEEEDDD